ncbi:MAG TPA: transcriptional regulator [Paracoccus sp.]|nr:transcriptional regulator [Paracoccus sp. (in: a-proteobacteria)]
MANFDTVIETTFSALSDPTRCAVVKALSQGPAAVSKLAQPFEMALPSFTQHLAVLEDAGLISSERQGRTRICSLDPDALRRAEDWLATYRRQAEERLDRLEAHPDQQKKDNPDD